jgi:hypothetical protein
MKRLKANHKIAIKFEQLCEFMDKMVLEDEGERYFIRDIEHNDSYQRAPLDLPPGTDYKIVVEE